MSLCIKEKQKFLSFAVLITGRQLIRDSISVVVMLLDAAGFAAKKINNIYYSNTSFEIQCVRHDSEFKSNTLITQF